MKYFYRLVLLTGLWLLALSAYPADMTDEEAYGMMAVCAASTGLVAVKMDEDSSVRDVIFAEGKWWKQLLVDFAGSEAADLLVSVAAKEIQGLYNSGEVSWDELVSAAQNCSTMKTELGG